MSSSFVPSGAFFSMAKPQVHGVLPGCAVMEWQAPVCVYDGTLSSTVRWVYTIEWSFSCSSSLKTCETGHTTLVLPLEYAEDVCHIRIVARGQLKETALCVPSVKLSVPTTPNLTSVWHSTLRPERSLFDALFLSTNVDSAAVADMGERTGVQVSLNGFCRLSNTRAGHVVEVKYPSRVPPFLSTTVCYVIPSPIQPMSLVNASLADILQDNDCTVVLCGTGDEGRAAVSCFLSTEEENERLLCLCFGGKGMLRLHQTKIPAESVMRRCQRLLYCVEEDNSSGVPPTSLLRGDASANLWLGSTVYFTQNNLGRAALRCGANWRIKAAAPETFDAVKQLTVLQNAIFPGLNLLSPSISSVSFTAIDQCAFSLHVSGTYLHLHPTLSCFPSNSCHPVRVTLTSSAFSAIRGEALFTDVLLRSIQEAPVGHPSTLTFDVQIASDAGKAEYTDVPLPVPGEVTLLYTYALYHYGASWIASDPADVFDHVISLIPLYLSTPSVFLTMMEQFDQVCAVAERHLRKRQEKASGGLIALFGNLTSSSTEPDSCVKSSSADGIVSQVINDLRKGTPATKCVGRLAAWANRLLTSVGCSKQPQYRQRLLETCPLFCPTTTREGDAPRQCYLVVLEQEVFREIRGYFVRFGHFDGSLSRHVTLEKFMHFALPRVQRPDDETFSGTLSCLFLWFSILVFELRLELLLHHFVLIVGTDEDASTRLSSHVNDVLERISIKYNHSEYRKKFIVQVIPPKSVPAALSALQCSVKATVLLNASVDQLEQREYVELHQLFKCSTDAFSADQKMHCVVSNPVGVLCKTDFIKERDFTFEQVEAMICAKQHACSTQGTFTFLPLSPSPRVLEENCGAPAEFSTDIATHMHHYSSRALSDLILGDAIDCYCTLV